MHVSGAGHSKLKKCIRGQYGRLHTMKRKSAKQANKSAHPHTGRTDTQNDGDSVQATNSYVPSRSSQTISIILTGLPRWP